MVRRAGSQVLAHPRALRPPPEMHGRFGTGQILLKVILQMQVQVTTPVRIISGMGPVLHVLGH